MHPQKTALSWYQQERAEDLERTRAILLKFWEVRNHKPPEPDIKTQADKFQAYLIYFLTGDSPESEHASIELTIRNLFENVKKGTINFDDFCNTIQQYPLRLIYIINHVLQLGIAGKPDAIIDDVEPRSLTRSDIEDMQKYVKEKEASLSISVADPSTGEFITPNFPENKSSRSFAMHSVGKVFTGMLALVMIHQGVFSRDDLDKPLTEDFIQSLPLSEKIKTHLHDNKITLHQLMTHRAGLGDYLGKYGDAIKQAVASKQEPLPIPQIKQPEDFLQYADETTYPVGEEHYSNLGIVLVGLAIQHTYNKQHSDDPLTYDQILQKYIIGPAGMSCFSTTRPDNGEYNRFDTLAPHIAGSPGGGYWTTSEDLVKFGRWAYHQSLQSSFRELLNDFGREFYKPDQEIITHTGRIPSASACLTVSLKTGAVVATLSNQSEVAIDMDAQIRRHILSTTGPVKKSDTVLEEGLDSNQTRSHKPS